MATMPNGMTTGSGDVQDHLDEDYDDVTASSHGLSPALRAQVKWSDESGLPENIGKSHGDLQEAMNAKHAYYEMTAVASAVACEREECAKIADRESEYYRERAKDHDDAMANEHWAIAAKASQIASAIRARSKRDEPRGLSAAEAPTSAEGVTPISPDPTTGGKG